MTGKGRRRRDDRATPPRRVTVGIAEIGGSGDGVGIVDGARVFTPLTAPGDLAVIEARGARGDLIELLERSPHRRTAPCRHFGRCGGCALQHLDIGFYRNWKRARVAEALSFAGFADTDVAPTIETPVASRRRAAFSVARRGDGVTLGFNARRSAEVVDLQECLILHEDIFTRLSALRLLAGMFDAARFDLAVTLCDNGLDVALTGVEESRGAMSPMVIGAARDAGAVRVTLNDEPIVIFDHPVITFGGVAVTPPPGGFLQASREGEAALIALVTDVVRGAKKIADLFSGCGTFALPLARAASVYAADADAASIAALTRAAADAQRGGLGINPVRTETRDLFERPLSAKELKDFDAVVFDPPRAGASAQAREIAASRAATVVAVSCNPSTFARDAAILVAGGYTLSQVTPIDQFVYSPHIEVVGVFKKS